MEPTGESDRRQLPTEPLQQTDDDLRNNLKTTSNSKMQRTGESQTTEEDMRHHQDATTAYGAGKRIGAGTGVERVTLAVHNKTIALPLAKKLQSKWPDQQHITMGGTLDQRAAPNELGALGIQILLKDKTNSSQNLGDHGAVRKSSMGHKIAKDHSGRYKEPNGLREQPGSRQPVFTDVRAQPHTIGDNAASTALIRNQNGNLTGQTEPPHSKSGMQSAKSGSSSLFPDVQARNHMISSIYQNYELPGKQDMHKQSSSLSFNTFRADKNQQYAQNVFLEKPKQLPATNMLSMQDQGHYMTEAASKQRDSTKSALDIGPRHSLPTSIGQGQSYFRAKKSLARSVYESQLSQKEHMLNKLREKQQKYALKQQRNPKLKGNLLVSGVHDSGLQTQDSLYQADEQWSHPNQSVQTVDAGADAADSQMFMPLIKGDKSYNEYITAGSSLLSSKITKSQSIMSPANKSTKLLDMERRKIAQAVALLDEAEMRALGNPAVAVNLENFSVLTEAFKKVVLDPPAKRSHQIYTGHMIEFIQRSCNYISQTKADISKQVELSTRESEQKIERLTKQLQARDATITEINTKLMKEPDMFADKKKQEEMKNLIADFFDSQSVLDASIGGVFSGSNKYHDVAPGARDKGQDSDASQDKSVKRRFFDLKDLLQLSNYSGAQGQMQEILRLSTQEQQDGGAGEFTRPSNIDRDLLDDDIISEFGGLMHQFLKDKAKDVQVTTSKRVIKQFLKNIQLVDAQVQTGFNDDLLIRELTAKIAELNEDIEDLRTDVHKAQARMKQELENLAREKAAGLINAGLVKNLTKTVEQKEDELDEEREKLKSALERLEFEREQTSELMERQAAKKEEFIFKLGQLQTRLADALSGRAQFQEQAQNLEASLKSEQRVSQERKELITRLRNEIEMLQVNMENVQETAAEAGQSAGRSLERTSQQVKNLLSAQDKAGNTDTAEAGPISHRTGAVSVEPVERKLKEDREASPGSGAGAGKPSPRSAARSESGSGRSKRNSSLGDLPTAEVKKESQKKGTGKSKILKALAKKKKDDGAGKQHSPGLRKSDKDTDSSPQGRTLPKGRQGKSSSIDVEGEGKMTDIGKQGRSSAKTIQTSLEQRLGAAFKAKISKDTLKGSSKQKSVESLKSQDSKQTGEVSSKKTVSTIRSGLKASLTSKVASELAKARAQGRTVVMKDQQTGYSIQAPSMQSELRGSLKGNLISKTDTQGLNSPTYAYGEIEEIAEQALASHQGEGIVTNTQYIAGNPADAMNQTAAGPCVSSDRSATTRNDMADLYRSKIGDGNTAYGRQQPQQRKGDFQQPVKTRQPGGETGAEQHSRDDSYDIIEDLKAEGIERRNSLVKGRRDTHYYLEKPLNDLMDSTQKMHLLRYYKAGKNTKMIDSQVPSVYYTTPQPLDATLGREPQSQNSYTPDESLNVSAQFAGIAAPRFARLSHVSRGVQTVVDTQTFVNILNINMKANDVASVGTQATRYHGDLSYLTKKYGVHKFDHGQSVTPEQIARDFALFEVELRNKRIFTCERPRDYLETPTGPSPLPNGSRYPATGVATSPLRRHMMDFNAGISPSLMLQSAGESSMHDDTQNIQRSIYAEAGRLDGADSQRGLTQELETIVRQANTLTDEENGDRAQLGRRYTQPRVAKATGDASACLQSPIGYLKQRNEESKRPARRSVGDEKSPPRKVTQPEAEEATPFRSINTDNHQNLLAWRQTNVILVKPNAPQHSSAANNAAPPIKHRTSVGGSPTRAAIQDTSTTEEPRTFTQQQKDFKEARDYYLSIQAAIAQTKNRD